MENVRLGSIKRESVIHIFDAIAGKKQISRAEIAQETGLSLMTVGKVADAFLERGIIVQAKENRSVAGRKAGLISLNTGKFALVLNVTSRAFHMTVVDCALEISDKLEYDYNPDFYFEENLYIFLKNVKIYILRHLSMADCMGIGIAVPGAYDAESDTVEGIRMPELRTVKLRNVVEDILKEKVLYIGEDIPSAAVSNTRSLEACCGKTVFYVYVGDTICGAVIRDGEAIFGHGVGYLGQTLTFDGKKLEDVLNTKTMNAEQYRHFVRALYNAAWLLAPDAVIVENHKTLADGDLIDRLNADFQTLFPPKTKNPPQISAGNADANHSAVGIAMQIRGMWRDRTISE